MTAPISLSALRELAEQRTRWGRKRLSLGRGDGDYHTKEHDIVSDAFHGANRKLHQALSDETLAALIAAALALRELVACKVIKELAEAKEREADTLEYHDMHRVTLGCARLDLMREYNDRKPLAWSAARKAAEAFK